MLALVGLQQALWILHNNTFYEPVCVCVYHCVLTHTYAIMRVNGIVPYMMYACAFGPLSIVSCHCLLRSLMCVCLNFVEVVSLYVCM